VDRIRQCFDLIDQIRHAYPVAPDSNQLLAVKIQLEGGYLVEILVDPEEAKINYEILCRSSAETAEDVSLMLEDWRHSTLADDPLEAFELLSSRFPIPDLQSCECAICSAVWLENMPASVICECQAVYHVDCYRSWLESDTTCRRVFDVIKGNCPTCDRVVRV
jgi:hypothetical protein